MQRRSQPAVLPPPGVFGFERFESWRPYQDKAVEACAGSDARFTVLVAPTGSGKSLTYLMTALLRGERAVILTSTKGLQSQLVRDYTSMGLADMRGRNSYPCRLYSDGTDCDSGLCKTGVFCSLRNGGCYYYDALERAKRADLVVTNYAFWVSANRYGTGLGDRTLLICDEAHALPEVLSNLLTVTIHKANPWMDPFAPADLLGMDMRDWVSWAETTLPRVNAVIEKSKKRIKRSDGGTKQERKEFSFLQNLAGSLELLSKADPDSGAVSTDGTMAKLAPIWPAPYAEGFLWRGVSRILATSATVCAKTMELMGVDPEDMLLLEYPHTFPKCNRMLYHIPTVRLNIRTPREGLTKWLLQIDNIIDRRRDRKGIVHTVSYKRRDFVTANSRNTDIMVIHNKRDTEVVVERFKTADPPAVLVSPSMSTGWDFPDAECEYQIIGKIPYPDTTDRITKARCKLDKEYAGYVAMQELIQICGRGVRSEADRCENFIIDDNVRWFIPRYRQFAPRWFLEAYESKSTIPLPPRTTSIRKE